MLVWAGACFFVFLIFVLLLFVLALPLYLLMAFGLRAMAKKAGLEKAWIAFIPIANFYIIGKLIKEIRVGTYVLPRAELVLPSALFVCLLFAGLNFWGDLLSLGVYLLTLVAYYRLYSLYRPRNAGVYTALSVFLITVPIFIFMMRNDDLIISGQPLEPNV